MASEQGGRPLVDLIRHTLIYGSGYVATAAVSLVLVPVYTFHLTPSQFGLLALMLVLYGIGKQVYDLGFTNSVGRFYFDGGSDRAAGLAQMRTTSISFLALYGGCLTGLLMITAGPLSQLLTGDAGNADLVRIVAATLYAETLALVPLTLIRMQERSMLYVSITVVRLVLALVLSVVFVAVLDWEVRGALLGNAIAVAAVVLLVLPDYRRALGSRFSGTLLRQMLSFGLPFVPVLLSTWVIDASDRYILELYRERDEVGFYTLAYRLGAVMQLAVAAFSMGWAPLRFRIYERIDAPGVYRRLATYYVLAVSLLGVALSLFAAEIVSVVSPPAYEPAAAIVPLLVLAYALQGMYLLTVTGMGVTKRTLPLTGIAVGGAAVNIALNLLFVPRWGMAAAALSTIAAYAVMVAGSWYASQRVYPIPYDWRRIALVTIIAITIVAVGALVSPSGVMGGAACAVAAWLVFVATLVVARVVAQEDIAAARAYLKGLKPGARRRAAGRKAAE